MFNKNKENWKHYVKQDEDITIEVKETKEICHIAASIPLNYSYFYSEQIMEIMENTKEVVESGDFICCSCETLTIFRTCPRKKKYDKIEELIAMLYSYKNMLPILLAMEEK